MTLPGRPGGAEESGSEDEEGENAGARPATILVAEDELLIRMALTEHLRDSGFRVLEAADGSEAQLLFRAYEPIEVMISDVNMPGMDGIALAEWVRKHNPDVHIVLISGQPMYRGRVPGAIFIDKPFAIENIEPLVRRLLAP
jgi:CheY-like chemotaxis protein